MHLLVIEKIHIHLVVIESCLGKKKKKMNKLKFLNVIFLSLKNISETLEVGYAVEQQKFFVYKHFTLLCGVIYHSTAFMPWQCLSFTYI